MSNAARVVLLQSLKIHIRSTGYNPIQGVSDTKYEHLRQLSKINSTLSIYLLKVIP